MNAGNTPGYLIKQIQSALCSAFPSKTKLEMMLRHQFSQNLEEIARGENLNEIVYKVVVDFNASNNLTKLIKKAHKENPNNADLKAIKEKFKITISLVKLLRPLEKQNIKPIQQAYRDCCNDKLVETTESEMPDNLNLNEILENLDSIPQYNDKEKPIIKFVDYLSKTRDIPNPIAEQLNQWLAEFDPKSSRMRLLPRNNLLRQVYQFFSQNVALGILVGILLALLTNAIGAWIAGLLFNDQDKALIMLGFLLFTPIPIIYLVTKINLRLDKISLFILLIIVILAEASIFSIIPTKTAKLDKKLDNYPKIAKLFEIKNIGKPDSLKKISIHKAEVRVIMRKSPLKPNELHVLLSDVEWIKWEKIRLIKRNYRGYIQFKISYDANPSGEFEMESEIVDYSFRPGSGLLSFVIGFVETAYLVPRQRTYVINLIENIIEENQVLEKLK
ncbi:MAG: hypothetical protein F6K55_31330 [Moorea sp. SIO4A3]|nr:hypothetical protein [Moorena sp. SIO4A3]